MTDKFETHELFKALGDPTRLRIIQLLHVQGATCVCDITTQLQQPQPTISRHLTHLKTLGLLSSERRGTWVWYTINPHLPDWCQQVITATPQPTA